MITNRQRYEQRHAQICRRAERQFAEGTTAETLAAAVHRAIAKHDGTGIAAVLAVMAAHLAMKEHRRSRGIENVQYANPERSHASTLQSPIGA